MTDHLQAYQYQLPEELIAKYPVTPRDHSRLMVIDRESGSIEKFYFYQIADFLTAGDRIIFNNTKVIPARLKGQKHSGGKVELFLIESLGESTWSALAKPAKKLNAGVEIHFSDDLKAKVLDEKEDGIRIVEFEFAGDFQQVLSNHGEMPLPPYIKRGELKTFDQERYQTVYATQAGAVAAPTAGLHFTKELIEKLKVKGVEIVEITLHVGLGTFRPVAVSKISEHKMHTENYFITQETAVALNKPAKREICVGTTSCRTLESSVNNQGLICPGNGSTEIFIYPGYQFKRVGSLLTNFHLPGSTLIMLVSAFAGYDLTMKAYRQAISDRFRFFSYGDAMLIL